MAADFFLGESLVGDGNEVAHIDLIIGSKSGPAGAAFCNALTNNKDGFTTLLAVVAPNLPCKPDTILFNKVTIKGAKQAVQMFGPAQAAVARAVVDSVESGVIPKDKADDLCIMVGVFIHWEAADDKKRLSIVSFRPKCLSLPETMISAPGNSRRSMKRRPNQVASTEPVSSSRTAIVRWIRRRNDGSTRTSTTWTRALTTVPSSTQPSSPSWRISRRSSYRRGRWKSSSRTVRKPSRRPARWRRFAAPRPDSLEHRVEELGRIGRRRRRRRRLPARRRIGSASGSGRAGPVTPLLGRDQVAVVRLAAVDDLDVVGAELLADPLRRSPRPRASVASSP